MSDNEPQPSLDDLVARYEKAQRTLDSLQRRATTYAEYAANLMHEFLYASGDLDESQRRRKIVNKEGQYKQPTLRFIPEDKGREVLTGVEELRVKCEELEGQIQERGVTPLGRRP